MCSDPLLEPESKTLQGAMSLEVVEAAELETSCRNRQGGGIEDTRRPSLFTLLSLIESGDLGRILSYDGLLTKQTKNIGYAKVG